MTRNFFILWKRESFFLLFLLNTTLGVSGNRYSGGYHKSGGSLSKSGISHGGIDDNEEDLTTKIRHSQHGKKERPEQSVVFVPGQGMVIHQGGSQPKTVVYQFGNNGACGSGYGNNVNVNGPGGYAPSQQWQNAAFMWAAMFNGAQSNAGRGGGDGGSVPNSGGTNDGGTGVGNAGTGGQGQGSEGLSNNGYPGQGGRGPGTGYGDGSAMGSGRPGEENGQNGNYGSSGGPTGSYGSGYGAGHASGGGYGSGSGSPSGSGAGGPSDNANKGTELDTKSGSANMMNKLNLPAKVFAYYGATFACQNSQVYAEFIRLYGQGKAAKPTLRETDPLYSADESWVKKLTTNQDSNAPKPDTSVSQAEEKMKSLEEEDRHMMKFGEELIPMVVQIFLRFVKIRGCKDSELENYKYFNLMMDNEIRNIDTQGRKYPARYYVSKADTSVYEVFGDQQMNPFGRSMPKLKRLEEKKDN